jgi:tetratricopeptide (TPR) repeat protein
MFLTRIKQMTPAILLLIAIPLAIYVPGPESVRLWPIFAFSWLLIGTILGAWIFRESYKGGSEKLSKKAIEQRQQALQKARDFLRADQPRLAFQAVVPFLSETEVSDTHILAVRALVRSERMAQAKQILLDRREQIRELPLDRFRSWESLYDSCGIADNYSLLLQEKFSDTPETILVDMIAERMFQESQLDGLLDWATPMLEQSDLPEEARLSLKSHALRAIYLVSEANIRLGLTEDSLNLLDQYRAHYTHAALWHIEYARALSASGAITDSLEASLRGYQITGDPKLLMEAFSHLALHQDATEALAQFSEWSDLFPEDGLYQFFVGWVLYHSGKVSLAQHHIQKSIEIGGSHSLYAHLTLAMIYNKQHDLHDAMKEVHAAVQWLDLVPFVWECSSCGTVDTEPHTTCSSCGAWDQSTIVSLSTHNNANSLEIKSMRAAV